jgi:hypothetical protein
MASRRNIGWNPLIGVGFAALGVGYIYEWWKGSGEEAPVAPLPDGGATAGLGYASGRALRPGQKEGSGEGVRTLKLHPAGDINQRVRYIVTQIRKDSLDPEVISEARTIVSGRCPTAKGGNVNWCVRPKDYLGEARAVFHALTNPNSAMAMRYTRDHTTVDMFGSSALMRRLPAGDCDDFCIRAGAILRALGFHVQCRVVAEAGQPGQWSHIYLMVTTPDGQTTKAFDPTEPQHGPFWEVPRHMVSSVKDIPV